MVSVGFKLSLLLLAGMLIVPPAAAVDAPADSSVSYWGPIPPPDQQNTRPGIKIDRPLWEDCIYYPYQVAAAPVRAVAWGIGKTVVTLSDLRRLRLLRSIATLSFLPIQGRWGVSAGGGDGYGLSYTTYRSNLLGGDHRLKIGLRQTTRDNTKATLGLEFNQGHTNSFPVGIIFRHKPDCRYHGLGWNSPEAQLSYFANETFAVGGGYRRELSNTWRLEIESIYSTLETEIDDDDTAPQLGDVFPDPADQPFGFGLRSSGVYLNLSFKHNSQPFTGRPQHGGNQRLLASYFTSTDQHDLKFWTYRAEVQQFFPLWFTRRSLALRGVFARIQNQGADPIPFQRLLTNDDPDLLRGYHDLRFRDTGLVAASAEYRFPVWNYRGIDQLGLDAFLFCDLGQVFAHQNEISIPHLTESYGGGFRLVTTGGFIGRIEIGHSEEGTVFRMSAEQLFQYTKGGLFDGRNPVPTR